MAPPGTRRRGSGEEVSHVVTVYGEGVPANKGFWGVHERCHGVVVEEERVTAHHLKIHGPWPVRFGAGNPRREARATEREREGEGSSFPLGAERMPKIHGATSSTGIYGRSNRVQCGFDPTFGGLYSIWRFCSLRPARPVIDRGPRNYSSSHLAGYGPPSTGPIELLIRPKQ